jgi:hypothetical protein
VAPYGLGLSPGECGTEGAAARQSFAVTSGQTLSFDWSFSTLETQFQDHAFAVIDGQVFSLATSSSPGAGSKHFTCTFSHGGMASVAVGVIDTVDYVGVSTLNVCNLQVSAVPEPAALFVMVAGLGLWAGGTRRC